MKRISKCEAEALERTVTLLKLVKTCMDAIQDGGGNTYTSLALKTVAKGMRMWENGKVMRDDIVELERLLKGDDKPVPA